jgi:hypothetical protein
MVQCITPHATSPGFTAMMSNIAAKPLGLDRTSEGGSQLHHNHHPHHHHHHQAQQQHLTQDDNGHIVVSKRTCPASLSFCSCWQGECVHGME